MMWTKPRVALGVLLVGSLVGSSFAGVATARNAPGIAMFYGTQVALGANSTVYVAGNDLDNVASLTFTCSPAGSPVTATLTLSRVTALPNTGNALASISVPKASLAGLPSGATCALTSVSPESGQEFSWGARGAKWNLYIKKVPARLGVPNPQQLQSAFPTDQPPTVIVSPSAGSLANVTAASQVMCSMNWGGTFALKILKATRLRVSFYPQSLPAQGSIPTTCGLMLTFGDGSSVLAPGTLGDYTKALTYVPWVTGRIRIEITNNSDVPDSQLHVGLVADSSGGGSASSFSGVNLSTVTSVPFTQLRNFAGTQTYTPSRDDTGGTAYFDIRRPLASGVIYLGDDSLAGDPPNPQTSTTRYAMAEFTYKTSFFTDLTLIDQIGFAMSSRLYSDLAGTSPLSRSRRSTGCLATLVTGLQKIVAPAFWSKAEPDGTGGVIRYDTSGQHIVGYIGAAKKPEAYMTAQVKSYVQYVQGLGPLTINDDHNAANQSGPFNYTATYNSSNDTWTLTGTMTDGTVKPGPTLYVEGKSLYSAGTNAGTNYAMYGQDGPFSVVLDGKDYGWGNGSQIAGTGYQDLVKTIYRDFIAAFAYGYWGGKYGGGTNTGQQARNFTLDPKTSAYGNAGVPAASAAWNTYDELIRVKTSGGGGASGAYGTAYSDTFLPDGLSPAIGTYQARNWTITLGDPPGC
jgi:hypothetical protein